MRAALLAIGAVLAASGYEAAIPYFSRTRNVTVTATEKQNFIVIDVDVWQNARPDLSDLRLYDSGSQVPYVLVRQSGGRSTQESQGRILNLGEVGGHTEFDLDTSGFSEYDHVRLQLDAKNFINSAQVEGRHTPNDGSGTSLGRTTLYDFDKERLGLNFVLKFPPASFPYLHVRLAPGIHPDQVKGAYLSSFSESKAAWTNAGDCGPEPSTPKESTFRCELHAGMPLERIGFELGREPRTISSRPTLVLPNFNRTVVITDENGGEIERGTIRSVLLKRDDKTVFDQNLTIDLYPRVMRNFKVVVQNGDDAPVPIARVLPFSFSRRLYFDPQGKTALQLYYGDAKLEAPSYDYAKFFQQATDAAAAQLGPAQANPQFSGRPDERPWSERHSVVLWAAMIVVVVILGGLALRGLKGSSSST